MKIAMNKNMQDVFEHMGDPPLIQNYNRVSESRMRFNEYSLKEYMYFVENNQVKKSEERVWGRGRFVVKDYKRR